MTSRPPERIAVGDVALVVRPRPEHAEAVAAAVAASLEHLRPWMPWADDEATDPSFQRRRLEELQPAWDAGEDFQLLVLDPAGTEVLGGTGLHPRQGPGVLEIGYWLRPDATGRGLMTRVAAALTDVALGVEGVDEVQIHCDVANLPSAAVPRRLGFTMAREIDHEPQAPAETGRRQVWVTRSPTGG